MGVRDAFGVRIWLSILLLVALPSAVLATPPPLVVTAQPSPIAVLQTSTNDLCVFGSIRCSRSVSVHIFVNVAQPDDQAATADRSNSIDIPCGPTPRLWVVRLANDAGSVSIRRDRSAEGQVLAGSPQPIVIFPF